MKLFAVKCARGLAVRTRSNWIKSSVFPLPCSLFSCLLYFLPFQVFFAILIGAFALGQAGPNLEGLFTAAGAAGSIFETIDRVS